MQFTLHFTSKVEAQLEYLASNPALSKRFKAVKKALTYLAANPRHPSLNTHEFTSLSEKFGRKVFEAYAENHTPGAYRIFWYYGDAKSEVTIISITPHP